MEDRFPEEEYRKVCSALKPSFQAEQEVVNMAEPGKRPWRKKKAFVTLAAVLALTLSVSIVSVAATDGKIVEEVKDKVSVWFRNLTLDEEASTQDHMVLRAEDGTYIAIDQDERNPKQQVIGTGDWRPGDRHYGRIAGRRRIYDGIYL